VKQRVRILKEIPEVKLIKRKLGPQSIGDELELWAWDATVLKRHGIAEILQDPTVPELRKLVLAEERSLEPCPLPEGFYNSVARNASIFLSEGKREEAKELESQFFSLLEIRMPKLVRLALSPETPVGLQPEEHFLVNNLAEIIENWTRRLRRLFESKEEVGKNEPGRSVQHVAGNEADIQKQRVPASELHAGGTAAQG